MESFIKPVKGKISSSVDTSFRPSAIYRRHPQPLKHVRYPWFVKPKESRLTVCIAAACEDGKTIVSATDGLVSLGAATGENVLGKIQWFGPWQFMYSGVPSNFSMVYEEIVNMYAEDKSLLSRMKVQETVKRAYSQVVSRLSSFPVLNPLGMTMEKFIETGRNSFGDETYAALLQDITANGRNFSDQIVVTGWGHSPNSAMVYEIGQYGDAIHTSMGFTVIGSGASLAHTTLVLLGQARHLDLSETIFNVACAKFSSERSGELDVGRRTTIYISRKGDDAQKSDGKFIEAEDIAKLRDLWEKHLKPRIPDEARSEIVGIAARASGGKVSVRNMVEVISANQRIGAKRKKTQPKRSTKS